MTALALIAHAALLLAVTIAAAGFGAYYARRDAPATTPRRPPLPPDVTIAADTLGVTYRPTRHGVTATARTAKRTIVAHGQSNAEALVRLLYDNPQIWEK